MITVTRGLRRVGLAALTALALSAPAGAQAAAADPGCPWRPVTQTFLPWTDPAWYMSVPDGGLEAGGAGWTLDGGAAVVAGNEPYRVRAPGDQWSLALRAGASATSPDVCIGVEHPTIRFFARNTGTADSRLAVWVVFTDPGGKRRSLPVGVITGTSAWAPTLIIPVTVNALSVLHTQKIGLRFAATDGGGGWSIDDVYVDPYGKG